MTLWHASGSTAFLAARKSASLPPGCGRQMRMWLILIVIHEDSAREEGLQARLDGLQGPEGA